MLDWTSYLCHKCILPCSRRRQCNLLCVDAHAHTHSHPHLRLNALSFIKQLICFHVKNRMLQITHQLSFLLCDIIFVQNKIKWNTLSINFHVQPRTSIIFDCHIALFSLGAHFPHALSHVCRMFSNMKNANIFGKIDFAFNFQWEIENSHVYKCYQLLCRYWLFSTRNKFWRKFIQSGNFIEVIRLWLHCFVQLILLLSAAFWSSQPEFWAPDTASKIVRQRF